MARLDIQGGPVEGLTYYSVAQRYIVRHTQYI